MKWKHSRFLLLSYVVMLTAFVVAGCTSKQDPYEVLAVCGNHSCGDLVMVTTDTSSEGFQYLNPSLSPDETRILFTADWWAIPSQRDDPGDVPFVDNRQMIVLPNQVGLDPVQTLEEQGGELIGLLETSVPYAGGEPSLTDLLTDDKSGPNWYDDSHVVFSVRTVELGNQYRMLRADITVPAFSPVEILFMEPSDALSSPQFFQHLEPRLSPDRRWLAFTRSGCVLPDSFETCTGTAIWVLDMNTAGLNHGYDAVAYPVTNEYSRLETPQWSPDGTNIVFSGGLDVNGAGTGSGTEIFTVDFDTSGVSRDLDRNLRQLTFTGRTPGDPIAGVLNYSPVYDVSGNNVYFVSTRRAPATTLHDRNIWQIPADGSLDPVIFFFTRSDNVDPFVLPDGRVIMSSGMGFPTEMLNRLEEESYLRFVEQNLGVDEVQLRSMANNERQQLEFFEGVMSHIYIYRP